MTDVTEKDVGKICVFWNDNEKVKSIGILTCLSTFYYNKDGKICKETRYENGMTCWKHCRRLTNGEVERLCL